MKLVYANYLIPSFMINQEYIDKYEQRGKRNE